jgi:hypothetical protein
MQNFAVETGGGYSYPGREDEKPYTRVIPFLENS